MLQRVVSHLKGRFTRCRRCGSEPHHVRHHGRPSSEPVQFGPVAPRHSLECRFGACTGQHTLLAAAEAEWNDKHAQAARRGRKVA